MSDDHFRTPPLVGQPACQTPTVTSAQASIGPDESGTNRIVRLKSLPALVRSDLLSELLAGRPHMARSPLPKLTTVLGGEMCDLLVSVLIGPHVALNFTTVRARDLIASARAGCSSKCLGSSLETKGWQWHP
jgi:hypothetical protein